MRVYLREFSQKWRVINIKNQIGRNIISYYTHKITKKKKERKTSKANNGMHYPINFSKNIIWLLGAHMHLFTVKLERVELFNILSNALLAGLAGHNTIF